MKTSQEKIRVGKEISSRFLIAMEYILNNYRVYKVENMKQFVASVGLLQPHLVAIREQENRRVTLYNVYMLVSTYNISADWILTGRGNIVE